MRGADPTLTPAPLPEGAGRFEAPAAQVVYRALAALLDYPSEPLQSNLAEVAAALSTLDTGAGATLRPLLALVERSDLLDLQEAYIDTFDRGRRTSLNLFEHVHGDSRDRGQAMVDLLEMYRAAGLEPASDQLPDYLPAFLEYLSLLGDAQAREELGEVAHLLQTIGAALTRRRSPYAAVFDVLLALSGEQPAGAQPAGDGDPADDTSFAAIDAAWKEEPVSFLDAAAPCGSQRRTEAQAVQFHRRAL